jgi:zinc protease
VKRHGVPLALALLVLPAAALAQPPAAAPSQNPATAPGTVMKGRAPVSKEILKVTLPKPQEADLSNGVHLMVLEDHRAPIVTFQLLIEGAGGYYDPKDIPGLAGFTATLMREGTESRTSEQISEQLDRLAASVTVTAAIASPFAVVSGSGLSDTVDTVLGILEDVLTHPAFSQAEIDRYKLRTKATLMNQRSQPAFLAQERFQRVVYGEHPASRVSATPESLEALTRERLVEFHRTHYVPDRAVIAIAGDMTLAVAKQKVEAALGGWKKSGGDMPATQDPTALKGPSVSLVARPGSVQTSLIVGTQSIERTNPDYEALTVANRVLGGPNARLFDHLREQKGYTYGAGSTFSAGRFRGAWSASTDVRTEVTDPALTDLLDEIRQMRETPVPPQELSNIKRSIVASFARSLENPNAILNNYIESYLYKLPADYWDKYPDRINAVSAADVQRVAQKYWGADRLQVVAVGDAAKIEPALKKLGAYETFDADGKPVK